jgi:prenyltransferase beta subunit
MQISYELSGKGKHNDFIFYFIFHFLFKLCAFKTYEGAFGQNPDAEAHGGSTFCVIASLYLMDKLDVLSKEQTDRLIQWCLNRQTTGFSGRVNKPWDTCYSFWIGSTLKVLRKYAHRFDKIHGINK